MSDLLVKLLYYTPDAQKAVASAAKLCYSSSGIDDIMDNLTDEKAQGFVNMLTEIGHESPIEHAVFTFGISGVSRSFLAQMTRHRIASYSVKSQRYVKEGQFSYVIPPQIREIPEALERYKEIMQKDQEAYNRITDLLEQKHIADLILNGMDEKEAKKAAQKMSIEDARFVLPNACETQMIVTMNARSLKNFFRQRCCMRAQWEIRAVAEEMLKLVKGVAPALFKNFGPPCISGPCPEGKMSCGKRSQIIEKYKKL